MKLTYWPDPILKKVCEPVTKFDESLKEVVREMFKIMDDNNGIGLSACQVGIDKRFFVMKVPVGMIELMSAVIINPEIVSGNGIISVEEGCLSFPGIKVKVERFSWIDVKYQDIEGNIKNGSFDDIASVCFQHELDHLNGKTFIEYLPKITQEYMTKRFLREQSWKQKK